MTAARAATGPVAARSAEATATATATTVAAAAATATATASPEAGPAGTSAAATASEHRAVRAKSPKQIATKPASQTAPKSGPARALEKLGLVRDIDLALHLPLRYEDETRISRLADARDGQTVQIEGVVTGSRIEQRARRQLLVHIDDGSGELLLRFLHFYPSHQKALAVGACVRVRGELRGGFLGREMVHPSFKPVTGETPLATALTPVYPTSAQLPQAYLRKAVASALQRAPLAELLPSGCVPRGLPPLKEALEFLHQPAPEVPLGALEDRSHPAWQRLKFDELLAQQLSRLQAQRERAALRAPALRTPAPRAAVPADPASPDGARGLHERLLAALPFQLTAAQRRVAEEIAHDLARPQPTHRLLQGDVGSGKTVVAALAATIAIDAGWQCALMAPTEILADQHFRKLVGWLEPLGVGVAWLTGGQKGKARAQMMASVADGSARLVVGTHAVIQDRVVFQRLGLAIIDEQHRFGVAQRLALRQKLVEQAGASPALEPHLLMMSATPIPRTLSMTYFADLDVSTLDELPPGRTPIVTKLFADTRRDDVIARVREAVASGRQVYWVCPLIEESETLDLKNATATHAQLAAALPESAVGLLHGRMGAAEKAAVMEGFTGGHMAVLVSTTVIEVGVDVPGASLMVIEHAERFGLSQLHQLRGRVGRGSAASVCVLLYTPPLSDTGRARLKAMSETNDGFEIARRDLDIRGPGEFMGARQSGAALLRFADLNEDDVLLAHARAMAPGLLANHPGAARAHVERWLGGKADYLKA
ncbi:MAG: ATP-dependent DNA helicase RecG [Methylibium sp.]|nr:ATP-dependent DNA helicase RecG [Methylibium sp.]